jgi:hypothetical protein
MGKWQALSTLEYDLVHETFIPFNNRHLLKIMLAADPKKRKKYDFYKMIIGELWPELLEIPVNPKKN